ncbi:MAG: hypothetical protein IJU76_05775 [Desulfovibrionaceae bacterium]|nr:hypothetical protein [Desulfovibrionaceae bacterium]
MAGIHDIVAKFPKLLTIANACAKANHLVQARYHLPTQIFDGTKLYVINSKSEAFNNILRRTPKEVFKQGGDYTVPLGSTSTQAIISAYGLSNSTIYSNKLWTQYLAAFKSDPTLNSAKVVMMFLRAAAIMKVIAMSGSTLSNDKNIGLCLEILSVTDPLIISFFADMVS